MDPIIQSQIDEYKKKIENEPKNSLYLDLAELYYKTGNVDDTMNICKKGLDLYPDYIDARVFLTKIYIEKDMIKEAKEELCKVLIVDHLNILANTMLETILRYEGKDEEANKIKEQVNSLQANNPSISAINSGKTVETTTAAEIYVNQGLIDEAIKIYEKIALSNSMDMAVHNRLKEIRKMKEEQYLEFQKKKQRIKETLYKLQEDIKQMQDRIQNLEKEL